MSADSAELFHTLVLGAKFLDFVYPYYLYIDNWMHVVSYNVLFMYIVWFNLTLIMKPHNQSISSAVLNINLYIFRKGFNQLLKQICILFLFTIRLISVLMLFFYSNFLTKLMFCLSIFTVFRHYISGMLDSWHYRRNNRKCFIKWNNRNVPRKSIFVIE